MTNENQIRTIIEEWAKAVREEDRHGVLKNHHKDIVMFDLPYPLQSKGMDEYKKTWELFLTGLSNQKYLTLLKWKLPQLMTSLSVMV